MPDSQAIIREIALERMRQLVEKGYDFSHDDKHDHAELAQAAMACLQSSLHYPDRELVYGDEDAAFWWPNGWSPMKRKAPRAELIRAAAFIVAEIERLDRVAAKA